MERIACRLTEYLCKHSVINEDDYELYQFGLQSGIELLFCFGCSILIALAMDTVISVIIFWILFLCIRSYIGGIHLKKYCWCFLFSCFISNGIGLVNQNLIIPIGASIIIVIATAGYICVSAMFRLKSEENNRDANMYFLKKMSINIMLFMAVVYLLYVYSCNKYISLCAYTMIIIVISEFLAKIAEKHAL